MNLLKGFKEKISLVSEDISNSVLSKSKPKSSEVPDSIGLQSIGAAEILKNYQQAWADIHHENYKISKLAEQADKHLDQIFVSATNRYDIFSKLHFEVCGIDKLSTDIDTTLHRIDRLKESCTALEDLLCILENQIEEGQIVKSKCLKNQEFQQHRRRSLQDLETKKVQLAHNHAKKMTDLESKRQKTLLERQATFEEEFQRDLNHYRTSGHFDRSHSSSSEPASGNPVVDLGKQTTSLVTTKSSGLSEDSVLASLEPDVDEKMSAELDSFLQEGAAANDEKTVIESEHDSSSESSSCEPEIATPDSTSHT